MIVGIVGAEAAKFTALGEERAKNLIATLLNPGDILVSGRCHLGGIDVWAEEAADRLGLEKKIYPPKTRNWDQGYKPRNLLIARNSAVLHCIVVDIYPPEFIGMTFDGCYHCVDARLPHVKSGACWTALKVLERKKPAHWHIIANA